MSRIIISLAVLSLAAGLAGCAQTAAHRHDARGPGAGAMHERMARAGTVEERHALMGEHHKLMHEQMAARGHGGGMGMGGGMAMEDCMAPHKH